MIFGGTNGVRIGGHTTHCLFSIFIIPINTARAIIASPKLLLADEPTGNLHSSQGEEIMELFRKLNEEGMTIVQVTHSEKNASYGKRIVQLRDGWVV